MIFLGIFSRISVESCSVDLQVGVQLTQRISVSQSMSQRIMSYPWTMRRKTPTDYIDLKKVVCFPGRIILVLENNFSFLLLIPPRFFIFWIHFYHSKNKISNLKSFFFYSFSDKQKTDRVSTLFSVDIFLQIHFKFIWDENLNSKFLSNSLVVYVTGCN